MTISTDALIEFFGTEDAVTTTGGSITDGEFEPAGEWTNDDDAPEIFAVLVAQWATATSIAGKPLNLLGRPKSIRGANDAAAPSASNPIIMLGTFIAPASTGSTDFYMPLAAGRARLPNGKSSQVWEFYVENQTDQTVSENWSLYVTPVTVGPHP